MMDPIFFKRQSSHYNPQDDKTWRFRLSEEMFSEFSNETKIYFELSGDDGREVKTVYQKTSLLFA